MEHSFGTYAKELKEDIAAYIELRIQYAKLLAYEKIAQLIAKSISFILIAFFSFFAFFFLSFAGGYYIGQLLNNIALGFGIICLLYLLLLFLVIVLRKNHLELFITNKVIEGLTTPKKETNETQ